MEDYKKNKISDKIIEFLSNFDDNELKFVEECVCAMVEEILTQDIKKLESEELER